MIRSPLIFLKISLLQISLIALSFLLAFKCGSVSGKVAVKLLTKAAVWRLDGSWRIPCQAHSWCCRQEVSVPCHVGLSIRLFRTQLHPEQGIQEKEKRIPTQKQQFFHNVNSEVQLFLLMIFYSLESSHWSQRWEWREELSFTSWRKEYQNLWTYL